MTIFYFTEGLSNKNLDFPCLFGCIQSHRKQLRILYILLQIDKKNPPTPSPNLLEHAKYTPLLANLSSAVTK